MKTLSKLFALVLTAVALSGAAWAGDLMGDAERSLYETHFNQEELTRQF